MKKRAKQMPKYAKKNIYIESIFENVEFNEFRYLITSFDFRVFCFEIF